MTLNLLLPLLLSTRADAAVNQPPGLGGSAEGFGVGLFVGGPTGLALAWRPGGPSYLQGVVGWSIPDERLALSGDYVWTITELTGAAEPNLVFPIYVGLGGRVRIDGDDDENDKKDRDNWNGSYFGLRVPVGIAFTPRNTAIDVYFEIAPSINLLPDTDVDLDGGLGVRFYPF